MILLAWGYRNLHRRFSTIAMHGSLGWLITAYIQCDVPLFVVLTALSGESGLGIITFRDKAQMG